MPVGADPVEVVVVSSQEEVVVVLSVVDQDSVADIWTFMLMPPGKTELPMLTLMFIWSVVEPPWPAGAVEPWVWIVVVWVTPGEGASMGAGAAGAWLMGTWPKGRNTNSPLRFIVILPVVRMPASVPKLFLNKSARPISRSQCEPGRIPH